MNNFTMNIHTWKTQDGKLVLPELPEYHISLPQRYHGGLSVGMSMLKLLSEVQRVPNSHTTT